jgi:CHASE2 domain-containing sensor protein
MKHAWLAAAGFALGWLTTKAWQDPGCRLGLAVFLVLTAIMFLAFALAVVGHGRGPGSPDHDDGD